MQDTIGKPWRAMISKRAADQLWPGQEPNRPDGNPLEGAEQQTRGSHRGRCRHARAWSRRTIRRSRCTFLLVGAMSATTMQLVLHTVVRPEEVIPAVRTVVTKRRCEPSCVEHPHARRSGDGVCRDAAVDDVVARDVRCARARCWRSLEYTVYWPTPWRGGRLRSAFVSRSAPSIRPSSGRSSPPEMRLVVMGAAIGLGAAIWLSRLMSSLLFEVQPHDLATYAAAGLTVTMVALLACYLPARRVLRVVSGHRAES